MPEHWTTHRLDEVVDVLDRMRVPVSGDERARRGGSVPYYGTTGQAGWIDDFLFDEVLVLLGEDAIDFLDPMARKAYLISGPAWVNNHAHVLRARADVILPEFLTFALNNTDYSQHASFATRSKLTQASMRRIELLVPSLVEQRRIVDLIRALDEAARRSAALSHASALALAALRRELLDHSPAQRAPLGEHASIVARLVDPTTPEMRSLLHIGIENIESTTGRLLAPRTAAEDGVTSGKHLFTTEDVIYSKIRPNLRKAVLPGFVGLCSADAYPLRPGDGLSGRYLLHALLSDSFTQAAVGKSMRTKMPKVNRSELFTIEIPMPPRDTQESVARTLDAVLRLRDAAAVVADHVQATRSALLADLLMGNREIPESYDRLLESA